MEASKDTSGSIVKVIETNDDAQISKLACVKLGYFRDDFVHVFVKTPQKRAPLINRGYYTRFAALRSLLMHFFAQTSDYQQRQVLVLGAGFDTSFFQLVKDGHLPSNLSYIELDFLDVTRRKASAIKHTPELYKIMDEGKGTNHVVNIDTGTVSVKFTPPHSFAYSLVPADLRDLHQVKQALENDSLSHSIDYSLPTFIMAECVLVYMQPSESDALLSWLSQTFSNSVIAIYEQINPHDAFGKQMIINLNARGCPLLGIVSSVEEYKEKLRRCGWHQAEVKTMSDISSTALDPIDLRRIQRIEIFDEFEEWDLIQAHYCIALGINSNFSFNFPPAPYSASASCSAPRGIASTQDDPRLHVLQSLQYLKK